MILMQGLELSELSLLLDLLLDLSRAVNIDDKILRMQHAHLLVQLQQQGAVWHFPV